MRGIDSKSYEASNKFLRENGSSCRGLTGVHFRLPYCFISRKTEAESLQECRTYIKIYNIQYYSQLNFSRSLDIVVDQTVLLPLNRHVIYHHFEKDGSQRLYLKASPTQLHPYTSHPPYSSDSHPLQLALPYSCTGSNAAVRPQL